MPRLGSRKSRNGCLLCKARRVKCDEKRPCASCIKYGAECSLLQQATNKQPRPGEFSTTRTDSPLLSSPAHAQDHASPSISQPTQFPTIAHSHDARTQLQLMHHYMAYALPTIPANPAAQAVWACNVPEYAFRFPFLLHGIFAYSAYHLAHLNHGAQRDHYLMLANTYQIETVRGVSDALLELGQENCHALFAASSFLALIAFVGKNSLADLIDISLMMRGMSAIIDQTEELLNAGPVAPLFAVYPCPDPPASLVALLEVLRGPEFVRVVASSRTVSTAAWELRDTIELCLNSSHHPLVRVVSSWLIQINNQFWELAQEGHDSACNQVLKWYAQVLKQAAHHWWFLESWSKVDWIQEPGDHLHAADE